MKLLVSRLPVASLFCKWPSLDCISVSDAFCTETGLPKHRLKKRKWLRLLEPSGTPLPNPDVAQHITKCVEERKTDSAVLMVDISDSLSASFSVPHGTFFVEKMSAFVDFSSSSVIFFFFRDSAVWILYRTLLPLVYESVFWLNLSRRFESILISTTSSTSMDSRSRVVFDESDIVYFDELCSGLTKAFLMDSEIAGVSVTLLPLESYHSFQYDFSGDFLSSSTELKQVDTVLQQCLSNEGGCEGRISGSNRTVCAYPCFEDATGDVIAIVSYVYDRSRMAKLEPATTFVTYLLRPLIEEWHEVCGSLLLQTARLSTDRLLYNDRTELRARYSQLETLAQLGNIAILETDKLALMEEALHLFGSSLFPEDLRRFLPHPRSSSDDLFNPIRCVFLIAGFDICVESYPIETTQRLPTMISRRNSLRLSRDQIHFLTDFSCENLPEIDVAYGIRQAEISHLIQNIDLGVLEEDIAANHELKMVRLAKRSGRQLFLGVLFHSDHRPLGDFSTFMISVAEIVVNALDRMFVEKRLFQSEQQLRYIWRSVKEPMVVFREDSGIIVETNSIAEQLFDISTEPPTLENGDADSVEQLQDVRWIADVFKKLDQFAQLAESVNGIRLFVETVAKIEEQNKVVTMKEHPGLQFCMNLSKTFDPMTESPLCIVVFRDVSEANRRQTAEVQALKSEAANRMKSMIVHTLSHELRNPIQGILSMSQILKEEKSLSRYQRECVGYIASATDFLLLLIADVLDSSRIEAGKFVLEQRPFDMLLALEECVDLMTLQLTSKKIELSIMCDPKLQFLVIGDSRRTKQVILNLLSNAVKFTPVYGSIRLGLSIRGIKNSDNSSLETGLVHRSCANPSIGEVSTSEIIMVELQVVDTGVGFDDREADLLWRPFSQLGVPSAGFSQQHVGTGLGLSICSTLVESMNGQYGASSRGRGTGSTFYVRIPYHVQPDSESMLAARLHQVRSYLATNHELASLQVIVVGRVVEIAPGIQAMLEMMHNEVSTASPHLWRSDILPCASLHEMPVVVSSFRGSASNKSKILLFVDMDDDEGLVSLSAGLQEQRPPFSSSSDSCHPAVFPILTSRAYEDEVLYAPRTQTLLELLASICQMQFVPPRFLRKPTRVEVAFDVLWSCLVTPTEASQSTSKCLEKPIVASSSVCHSYTSSSELSLSTDFDNEGREILIVDDDAVVRNVMSMLLQKAGFKVQSAVDGKEGVDAVLQRALQVERTKTANDSCRTRMFDAVLMDMIMPVMNGVEACRELRSAGFTNLPIIGCTANCIPDVEAQDVGSRSKGGVESFLQKTMFSDCLLKPVSKKDLIVMIDKWANSGRILDGTS
eukprot:ANDGO_01690.mRNA.1 Hybrid signal transduction histidine kinase B